MYPEAVRNDLLEVAGQPWVVLAPRVTLYEEPNAKSRAIGQIGYELVPVSDRSERDKSGSTVTWQRVQLPNGRWGWVDGNLLWEHAREEHICFAQVDGRWVISAFNAGQ